MTGIAEAAKSLKKRAHRKPGRRLFEYQKENRCIRIKEPMKPGDYFRASSLGYECWREVALAGRYEFIREEHIQAGLQITFDIGDSFHSLYREAYYGPMGEWAGAWLCRHCGWDTDEAGLSEPPTKKTSGRVARMPKECPDCGAPFINPDPSDDPMEQYVRFKEWLVRDESILLEGHPDGWSLFSAPRRLADLKSQSANGFPTRRSIDEKHMMQGQSYLHLCHDREGSIWYLNKSPWGDSPSFVRNFDFSFNKDFFANLVVKPLDILQNSLTGGPLPERGCASRDCPRAKVCQLADVCFEG